jgi:hypothetical protein
MCAVYLFDGNLDGNELDTFALALHRIDPSYIPGDFRLAMESGARLPFQLLLTPLLRHLPLIQVSIIGRLALYALLAGAYGRLARKIGLDVVETLIVGAIYVLIGNDICTSEFIVVGVESKALAYAGVFWGLDAIIDRRWASAGACFGLAVTIHPAVGSWSALAAIAPLWRPPREAWRRGLPVFLVTAAPGVVLNLPTVVDTSAQTDLGTWAYVYFRHPHHLVPSCFLKWPDDLLRFAIAVALALRSLSIDFATAAERTIARFSRATLVIFVIGVYLSVMPNAACFLYTYPFRIGDTLFPLFALMLAVRHLLPRHLPSAARAFAIGAVLVLSVLALRRDWKQDREWAADKARPAYAWVKANTPKDGLVLCAASTRGSTWSGRRSRRSKRCRRIRRTSRSGTSASSISTAACRRSSKASSRSKSSSATSRRSRPRRFSVSPPSTTRAISSGRARAARSRTRRSTTTACGRSFAYDGLNAHDPPFHFPLGVRRW